jgi:hypothetical protein
VLLLLVPEPKSAASTKATLRPLVTASRAMPVPVAPPTYNKQVKDLFLVIGRLFERHYLFLSRFGPREARYDYSVSLVVSRST